MKRYSRLSKYFGVILSGIFSICVYILWSNHVYAIGFPLDDSWIHQTYARNLVLFGQWTYGQGELSAGSTSPLWTLFLAVGYIFKINNKIWAYLIGCIILVLIAGIAQKQMTRITNKKSSKGLFLGLLLVFDWHLVWAAGSGMETLLYGLIVFVCLANLMGKDFSPLGLGLLAGISVWVRPDGITLLAPILLTIILVMDVTIKKRSQNLLEAVIGFLVLFVPYLSFNKLLAGTWWPNTFYAKQAEYASYQNILLIRRFITELSLPLTGASVILFLCAIYLVYDVIRQKKWKEIPGFLWWMGYVFIYAWKLPVTYQHGRYMIPLIPILIFWGYLGLLKFIERYGNKNWGSILSRVIGLSLGITCLSFWVLGAVNYATDVAIIETEMVDTAKWISANTEQGSIIAAHDIGAMGYFSDRKLIDLAGLISPDVVPFIRDENALINYLNQKDVDYVVIFSKWYVDLPKQGNIVYASSGKYSLPSGGDIMTVYQWPKNNRNKN